MITCSREEPKLLSERNRLDGRRYRRADQIQDPRVAGIKPGLSRAQPDDQLADDLTAWQQRRGVPGGRWIAEGGDLGTLDYHRCPRKAHHGRQRLQDRGSPALSAPPTSPSRAPTAAMASAGSRRAP